MLIQAMEKVVYGFGVNDSNGTAFYTSSDGGQYREKSYCTWASMLRRCYSHSQLQNNPAYIECSVVDEWRSYVNFREWYENQYKENGWQLDKDLVKKNNKIYSPDNCLFIPRKINSFIASDSKARPGGMTGVDWVKQRNKYRSRCRNPITGERKNLGYFDSQIEAHLAWKSEKHRIACELAKLVGNEKIAALLRIRYI